ncbi:MAG: hypothetical protein QM539_08155 [Alphaproteobacteria bacterium]|nr:hypothetical protein [Alphaproteobacteria bacterium]
MILFADSGGTSCKWGLKTDNDIMTFNSVSIAPYFNSIQQIKKVLKHEVIPHITHPQNLKKIFFFGTGLTYKENRQKMRQCLKIIGSKNTKIEIKTDIEASCIATNSKQNCVVSILGTGSNLSLWNGKKTFFNKPGLGYILGDEGSGAYLGKILCQQYLYQQLPLKIKQIFEKQCQVNPEIILKNVYSNPSPNTYLASFVPFLASNRRFKIIKNVIHEGLEHFVILHLKPIQHIEKYPIFFTGSISIVFKKELTSILQKHKLNTPKFVDQVIDNLLKL